MYDGSAPARRHGLHPGDGSAIVDNPTWLSGQLSHADRRKACDKWPLGGPGQAASSCAADVTCSTNEAISATARRASGLTSKLSWNMCIALSHT